ncbi:endonuclease domain-containing protein, partial [Anoxybacillus sp. LAT27]|nr:endonuclease domain-containing protein [Anoxybacillus sp. LAT27]
MGDRPERDIERTAWLEGRGYRVIRIAAADVLRDADAVAQAVVSLAAAPPPPASPVPLPVNGEDLTDFDPPRL